jgi:hypothetical protein
MTSRPRAAEVMRPIMPIAIRKTAMRTSTRLILYCIAKVTLALPVALMLMVAVERL